MENPTQSAKHSTPFRKKVFAALAGVPTGFVTTYGSLAKILGCGSAQAVGQALSNNPHAPEVPCHRVVKTDGTLGGFFGGTDQAACMRKRLLLEKEGIVFDSSRKVPERYILRKVKASNPPPAPANCPPHPSGGGK